MGVRGHVLMEFPPIIVDGDVYFMRNNGGTYRLDADTGKVRWKNQIGQPVGHLARLLARAPVRHLAVGQDHGAAGPAHGKVLWQKQLGSRTESSPIVRRGVVYFGTEGGAVYALYAQTGRVKWKHQVAAR